MELAVEDQQIAIKNGEVEIDLTLPRPGVALVRVREALAWTISDAVFERRAAGGWLEPESMRSFAVFLGTGGKKDGHDEDHDDDGDHEEWRIYKHGASS